jgi:hypothetical protein
MYVLYLRSCVFVNTNVSVNIACRQADALNGADERDALDKPSASVLLYGQRV